MRDDMAKLFIENLKYSYQNGSGTHVALKGIDACFEEGKFYAILGESGSGKTTLLSLMAGLEVPQQGTIRFDTVDLAKIGCPKWRLHYVNIIFQSYNLINYMTALENVLCAIDIYKVKTDNKKSYALELLQKVGIDSTKADRAILKLSGGEQQRVAIARALVGEVPIIMADEPTGNLDEETENHIIQIFKDLAKHGKIVIVVTHSKNVSRHADQVYHMRDGLLENQLNSYSTL